MDDKEVTRETVERMHQKTTTRGIHYGDCAWVKNAGHCNCMAAWDAGFLIGTVLKYDRFYE